MIKRSTGMAGLLALLAAAMTIQPALAQYSTATVFTSVQTKTTDIFTNARNILMVVGAIGVLALATMAFFGKFKWHWAVSRLGGLALIAVVSQILTSVGLTAPSS